MMGRFKKEPNLAHLVTISAAELRISDGIAWERRSGANPTPDLQPGSVLLLGAILERRRPIVRFQAGGNTC